MGDEVKENPENSESFLITDIQKQMEDYLSWARSRVKVLSARDFNSWMVNKKGGIILGATGWFFNTYSPDGNVKLDSAINKDLFIVGEKNYEDLIPYAIEHEAQESLAKILIRKGIVPSSDTHNTGMVKEYELAAKEGKQDRLYEYMMLIAPNRRSEYQPAYDKVKA